MLEQHTLQKKNLKGLQQEGTYCKHKNMHIQLQKLDLADGSCRKLLIESPDNNFVFVLTLFLTDFKLKKINWVPAV